MNLTTLGTTELVLIIAVAVIVVAGIAAWIFLRKRRTRRLRTQFGAEYDRAVKEDGSRRHAEVGLKDRTERVKSLDIRPLAPGDRARFVESWRRIQARFVDGPGGAVTEADQLLGDVMSTRGYPVSDFEQRAADISVDHPLVLTNYRTAHEIAVRQTQGKANTEDLRQAMIHYRTLSRNWSASRSWRRGRLRPDVITFHGLIRLRSSPMLSAKRAVVIDSRLLTGLPNQTNNINEPKLAQEGLRTSEIRYRRLFESARDGILILSAATLKITDVNPFMTELLDYSRDEFLGKELSEIGLFSDKEASQQAFRELQLNGYLRYEDLPLQTTAGKLREVEFVSNVYEEDGQQVIQCNIRDITDRKQAEEERRLLLARAQAARAEADTANGIKDEFLATVSHELRTPLNAILGWSQMLVTGKLDEHDSKRAVETILRNARAQREIIDDLLDISRIITGKLRLELRPVELATMIEAVVDGVRPAADARNIHLQTVIDPQINPISGDPDRLQQIIWNLLSNAIKFTPQGGRVEVRLERIDSHVEITISDTGQGIDPELLLHAFDRFRQSDSSTTRRHGGLGLGLSIVRQLVELHGGTVTAESPGVGEGSTFKVILPVTGVHHDPSDVEKTSQPMIEANSPTNPQPSLNGLRVLVVDDERDSCEIVAAVLTGSGAEVVSVGSAGEALAKMAQQQFDVLISDIGMPEMDGYALISKVRQLPVERGGRTPAAALTAYAGIEDRRRVLSTGYQMYIQKPVEPPNLTTAVAKLAERYAKAAGK